MFSLLPVALFWSALVTFVSTVSRSQQQMQTRLGLLFMAVVLTTMASFMFPLADLPGIEAVPIIGQLTLTADVLGGVDTPAYRYIISAAGSVVLALALIAATARLLRRESIVFRT
jgi:hypothetical protein